MVLLLKSLKMRANIPFSIRLSKVPNCVTAYEIYEPFFLDVASTFKDTVRTMVDPPKIRILKMLNV
jgi:SulP family sulfate permease